MNGLCLTFDESRFINQWTIAGIAYSYLGSDTQIDIIEIPTDITFLLQKESEVDVRLECRINNDAELGFVMGIYKGENLVSSSPIESEEVLLNFAFGEQQFKSIKAVINKWEALKKFGTGYIRSDLPVYENLGVDSDAQPIRQFVFGPLKNIKITKCYDNQTESYDGYELQSFEVTRHLSNSDGEINYGVVSNTLSATILNENRKLDEGYLKNYVSMGKRVIPYITVNEQKKKLGTYYISEWAIPMDSSWVDIQANDRLYDLHNIMYRGFFQEVSNEEGEKFKTVSMYDIIVSVIDSINENFLIALSNREYENDQLQLLINDIRLNYPVLAEKLQKRKNGNQKVIEGIDLEYLDYEIKNPYLERQALWDVLENITKSSLGYAYIDEQDRLIMTTDFYDARTTLLDKKISVDIVEISSAKMLFGNDIPIPTITQSNAYSMSKPSFRKAFATEVSTSYTTYDFDKTAGSDEDAKELITYYLIDEPFSVENRQGEKIRVYILYIPKYVFIGTCKVKKSDLISWDLFTNFIRAEVKEADFRNDLTVTIFGETVDSNSSQITNRLNEISPNKTQISYDCGTLVNSANMAES